jgi:hypothetical protein
MIHYITTNGIGNAWVANELGQVRNGQKLWFGPPYACMLLAAKTGVSVSVGKFLLGQAVRREVAPVEQKFPRTTYQPVEEAHDVTA